MFTKVFVVSCLLAVVLCAEEPVPILSQISDSSPDGSFEWSFESGDGTKAEQTGSVKALEKDETAASVEGSVSWTDPDGNKHEISYLADENGFQPQSDDIPVAPEIPVEIARALKWIADHPQKEEE